MGNSTRRWRLLLAGLIFSLAACGSVDTDRPATGSLSESSAGGEGNYGGEEVAALALADDVTYLSQLGLMRGHLLVGVRLYRRGQAEAAATHMKHPEDELYAALVPALQARGAPPMDAELSSLARAVETRQPERVVNLAYQELLAVIGAAEQTVNATARELGEVITELLRTAAEEYDIARAEDGSLQNAHEYQDSYGFVLVARDLQQQLRRMEANEASVRRIAEVLADVESTWPDLLPPQHLETPPAAVYSAAARVEIAVLRL